MRGDGWRRAPRGLYGRLGTSASSLTALALFRLLSECFCGSKTGALVSRLQSNWNIHEDARRDAHPGSGKRQVGPFVSWNESRKQALLLSLNCYYGHFSKFIFRTVHLYRLQGRFMFVRYEKRCLNLTLFIVSSLFTFRTGFLGFARNTNA